MSEQQASAVVEDVKEGDAGSEKDPSVAETDIAEQHKQLLDKHAQLGREAKAEREARVKAESRLAELEAEREKTRYESMNEEQKAEYRKSKEVETKTSSETQNLRNEKDLLRTIAESEDPKITKVLSALYWRSEEKGKFPDKDTIQSLIDGLTPGDDEEQTEEKPAEKKPPKVTAVAGTRAKEPSIDEEIDMISKSVKAKDGKFTYGDLLAARQRKNAAQAASSRG